MRAMPSKTGCSPSRPMEVYGCVLVRAWSSANAIAFGASDQILRLPMYRPTWKPSGGLYYYPVFSIDKNRPIYFSRICHNLHRVLRTTWPTQRTQSSRGLSFKGDSKAKYARIVLHALLKTPNGQSCPISVDDDDGRSSLCFSIKPLFLHDSRICPNSTKNTPVMSWLGGQSMPSSLARQQCYRSCSGSAFLHS